jgi:uncharacterized protein YndB with AHSA1/START domain
MATETARNKAQSAKVSYVTYIDSTPETVFRAFVESDLSREFWLHDQVSDWKAGSRWEHRRGDGNGVVDIAGTVLECDPPRRLVLTWARPFEADKLESFSRVAIEVEPQGPVVCLTVTHDQLDEGSEMHKGLEAGWPKVLSNLKTFLETGHTLKLDWGGLKKLGRWE